MMIQGGQGRSGQEIEQRANVALEMLGYGALVAGIVILVIILGAML